MTKEAVRFEAVSKSFGRVRAVEGLDFAIAPGTFCGLIGHNGAGKSTTLELLIGLLRPTSGRVWVHGVDVAADPTVARRWMGAVPEEPAVYDYLTAREFLTFVADVRGGGDVAAALELTGLGDAADRLLREYSQGMRRKTALAAALLGDPQVIVLDEALNGLDPPSAAQVKTTLRSLVNAGKTVILSTHVVETIEQVADRVLMLAHGRLVADVQVSDLREGELEALFLRRIAETRG